VTIDSIQRKRFKCTVAYDGTNYAGFQIQQNAFTVQEAIEQALSKIHGYPVKITGSGRTDAGVHAKGQVFHFESELAIKESNWVRAINANLKSDIRIVDATEVHSYFHARYDVKKKEYRYYLYMNRMEDPFRRYYMHHIRHTLDLELVEQTALLFLGEHDFTAFSSIRSTVRSKVRTIYRLDIVPRNDEIEFICEGNGFLFNMVRIIVGSLIAVGSNKRTFSQIEEALTTQNRKLVGPTAPPHGLYLWKVSYDQQDI
jgi:tRNA pseudouridine38-40 synthase